MSTRSTFEEQLEKKGYCTYFIVGVSMRPLLRERRDLIHLRRPSGRLKRYDVALFKRKNGQYVLHRVVKVRKDDYVFLGDNQIIREPGIHEDQILGVMEGYMRNGRYYTAGSPVYRCYVRIWTLLYPVRYLWKRLRMKNGHR